MQQEEIKPKLGLGRRLLFTLATIMLLYGVLEGVSLGIHLILEEESFSFAALQAERADIIATPDKPVSQEAGGVQDPEPFSHQAVHPYIGYVLDPDKDLEANRDTTRISEHGFRLVAPLPMAAGQHTGHTVSVAMLGGSVAAGVVREAYEPLLQALQEVPAFKGKEIVIYRLSTGGLKQPQQLMALTYFMSLGAHFDLVINLDGFNEIVLPSVNNIRQGVFPFYPRAWNYRVTNLTNPELLRVIGRLAYLEEARRQAARLFSRAPFRYSVTANVFWERIDLGVWQALQRKRAEATREITQKERTARTTTDYSAKGPQRVYSSEQAQYADLAAYWKQCSVILHNLAQGSGFYYFHFLHPNQYVAGSKVFTEQERERAVVEDHPYKQPAEVGYPYLIKAGQQLKAAGVPFTDLTMLFADNTETLYVDACCHVNRQGYTLMARAMGRVIADELSGRSSLAMQKAATDLLDE